MAGRAAIAREEPAEGEAVKHPLRRQAAAAFVVGREGKPIDYRSGINSPR